MSKISLGIGLDLINSLHIVHDWEFIYKKYDHGRVVFKTHKTEEIYRWWMILNEDKSILKWIENEYGVTDIGHHYQLGEKGLSLVFFWEQGEKFGRLNLTIPHA